MDERIISFLIRAKRATYAGRGAETLPSRPNSHDFLFAEDDLKYIDTYIGGVRFSGEEALWRDNAPFWAMNYIGRVLADGFSGDFLKEALLLVPKEIPYRGPSEYVNNGFTYRCAVEGDFDWFSGQEEIFKDELKIYECTFHGGSIM